MLDRELERLLTQRGWTRKTGDGYDEDDTGNDALRTFRMLRDGDFPDLPHTSDCGSRRMTALTLLEERHRADPKSVDVAILLAIELIDHDRPRAAALLEDVAARSQDDAGVLVRCISPPVTLQEWDRAKRWLDRLDRVEPKDFPLADDADFLRGKTAAAQGDLDVAWRHLQIAFNARPEIDDGVALANVLFRGQPARATPSTMSPGRR
jgi:hypothetical protein